jgi:predicted Zn-dependent protease
VEELFESGAYKEVKDSVVERAMLRIEGRLVEQVGLTEFEHDVRVVRSEQVNAFTLPGGHILVCSGLIEFSEDPGEVAAVVAHEMGHVEERHVIERLKREFGRSVLLSVLGSGSGGSLLGEIGSSSVSATFNREQEREADAYALRLMEQSRIRPEHLGSLFERMREEKYTGQGVPTLLKSHPDMNSRIKKAYEYEPDAGFEAKPFEMEWERIKERVGEASGDKGTS